MSTQGLWSVEERPSYYEVCVNDDCIAGWIYSKADAQLIAAAPELLEALQSAVAFINNQGCAEVNDDFEAFTEASATIAKATGERR